MARKTSSTPAAVESTPDTLVQLDPAAILMEDNARYSTEVSQAEAEQMKASILDVGRIMEPVGVTVLETPINGFTHRLRYGFRRVAGALLANESGAGVSVPAIILHEADAASTLREQVSENVVRKTLSLMDIATSARKMLDAGMSRQDVREVFKRPVGAKGGVAPASNAWLNMVLGLLDLPKAIQVRIHNGDIGLAAAYRLMKAPADKRIAILEKAEKEQDSVREAEEKEEKRFEAIEGKIKDATEKEEKVTSEFDGARIEVELAEKSVEQAQTAAQQLYQAEQKAKSAAATAKSEEAKKKAKEAIVKAAEARKAAETDAKTAEGRLEAAKRQIIKLNDSKEKYAKAAADARAKLEQARQAQAAKPKAAKKDGKVSPKAIEKAAKAEGVETGKKKLTGPEMRKAIEDLALVTSYPKVAAIGQAIKECFDSTITEGQMVKKLAAITGEPKASARK